LTGVEAATGAGLLFGIAVVRFFLLFVPVALVIGMVIGAVGGSTGAAIRRRRAARVEVPEARRVA
jgi:hypothetical protein